MYVIYEHGCPKVVEPAFYIVFLLKRKVVERDFLPEVADVIKALALAVQIVAAWVRVPMVAATKMDVGTTPCTEGAPTSPKTGREWKTSS